MTDDLVKELRNRAESWLEYECDEDAEIDTAAADRIELLKKETAGANARIKRLEKALRAMVWAYPYNAPHCADWQEETHAHTLADSALEGSQND